MFLFSLFLNFLVTSAKLVSDTKIGFSFLKVLFICVLGEIISASLRKIDAKFSRHGSDESDFFWINLAYNGFGITV